MAEVYGHLKPFARLAVFVRDKIRELKEEIEKLEAEKKMWSESEVREIINAWPGTHSGLTESFLGFHQCFGGTRIKRLETMVYLKKKELKKWQELFAFMKVCSQCNGEGMHHSQRGYVDCEHCKGRGKSD